MRVVFNGNNIYMNYENHHHNNRNKNRCPYHIPTITIATKITHTIRMTMLSRFSRRTIIIPQPKTVRGTIDRNRPTIVPWTTSQPGYLTRESNTTRRENLILVAWTPGVHKSFSRPLMVIASPRQLAIPPSCVCPEIQGRVTHLMKQLQLQP